MSQEIQAIIARLDRTEKEMLCALKDIKQTKEALIQMYPSTLTSISQTVTAKILPVVNHVVVNGVPVSEKSSMNIGLGELNDNSSNDNENIMDDVFVKAIRRIRGVDSLLINFLSPATINGGRGLIRPVETFPQFEEDLMLTSVNRLKGWPSGFYRNKETKETQLMVKGNSFIICFDSLPGVDGRNKIVLIQEEKIDIFTDLSSLDIEHLNALEGHLKHEMLELLKHHHFV